MEKLNKFGLALVALMIGTALLAACPSQDGTQPPTGPTPTPPPSGPGPTPAPKPAEFQTVGQPLFETSTGGEISSTAVPPNGFIVVNFNSNINPSSIVINSTIAMDTVFVTYRDASGDTLSVPNLIVTNSPANSLTISASGGFPSGTTFELNINSALSNIYSQALSTPVAASFTTTGSKNGTVATMKFTYDFNPAIPITSFTLSYGLTSRFAAGFTAYDVPSVQPTSVTPALSPQPVGSAVAVTAEYAGTFISGKTYYFAVQACAAGGCSPFPTTAGEDETSFTVP